MSQGQRHRFESPWHLEGPQSHGNRRSHPGAGKGRSPKAQQSLAVGQIRRRQQRRLKKPEVDEKLGRRISEVKRKCFKEGREISLKLRCSKVKKCLPMDSANGVY